MRCAAAEIGKQAAMTTEMRHLRWIAAVGERKIEECIGLPPVVAECQGHYLYNDRASAGKLWTRSLPFERQTRWTTTLLINPYGVLANDNTSGYGPWSDWETFTVIP